MIDAGAEPRIIQERTDFLVVHKPAGMHCLPEAGKGRNSCQPYSSGRHASSCPAGGMFADRTEAGSLAAWLCNVFPELFGLPDQGCGLVHRLDSGTSGLVLVARTVDALSRLKSLQERNLIKKEYHFLASSSGNGLAGSKPVFFSQVQDQSSSNIRSDTDEAPTWPRVVSSRFRPYGPGRKRVACIATGEKVAGKKDPTHEVYTTEFLSFAREEAQPELPIFDGRARITRGFRHQIRAHAAWTGYPLLGDLLYGGAPGSRLCLHAQTISFPEPDGRIITIEDDVDGLEHSE